MFLPRNVRVLTCDLTDSSSSLLFRLVQIALVIDISITFREDGQL